MARCGGGGGGVGRAPVVLLGPSCCAPRLVCVAEGLAGGLIRDGRTCTGCQWATPCPRVHPLQSFSRCVSHSALVSPVYPGYRGGGPCVVTCLSNPTLRHHAPPPNACPPVHGHHEAPLKLLSNAPILRTGLLPSFLHFDIHFYGHVFICFNIRFNLHFYIHFCLHFHLRFNLHFYIPINLYAISISVSILICTPLLGASRNAHIPVCCRGLVFASSQFRSTPPCPLYTNDFFCASGRQGLSFKRPTSTGTPQSDGSQTTAASRAVPPRRTSAGWCSQHRLGRRYVDGHRCLTGLCSVGMDVDVDGHRCLTGLCSVGMDVDVDGHRCGLHSP